MAYKLELSMSSKVHLVFHVSFLKKVISDNIPDQTILPEINEEEKIIIEPKTILETQIKKLQNQAITKYLIKWRKLLVEGMIWKISYFCINIHN
jgi:hypothetical protein